MDHQPSSYFCNLDEALWGAPSHKTEPWTILIAAIGARHLSQRVGIADAWH